MEPNQEQQNNLNEAQAGGFAARHSELFCITPLSKYLAMTLFVILPFLGGWVGYMYAPEKVVEVEKVIAVDRTTDVIENAVEIPAVPAGKLSFEDTEVGFTFMYSSDWGPVLIDDEKPVQKYDDVHNAYVSFDCEAEYAGDPCNFRTFLFKHVEGNSASIFMSSETLGHHENRVGRGAFWGDAAGVITSGYMSECEADSKCSIYTNPNGVVFAHYEADPPPEEMGYSPERYYLYNPNSPYYGMVLSPHRLAADLKGNSVTSEIFQKEVIDTFELLP